MRVLVTGSRGQLGGWVLDGRPAGADLDRVDLREDGPIDIRSPEARELAAKADVVLHLAALIDVQASMADPEETMSVNVEGTRNLVAGLRRGARFVFVSSAAVYGDAGERPVNEDAPTKPISPYGRSKLDAEAVVREGAGARGAAWVVVRPFNLYSSRQDPKSPYAGVITSFMRACFRGEPMRVDGDGRQTRDFVHASDVARFLWLVARDTRAAGGTFNVATGTSLTVLELAEAVRAACGSAADLRFGPPRPGDIHDSRADVRRARALGWAPKVSLGEGLRETAAGLRPLFQA